MSAVGGVWGVVYDALSDYTDDQSGAHEHGPDYDESDCFEGADDETYAGADSRGENISSLDDSFPFFNTLTALYLKPSYLPTTNSPTTSPPPTATPTAAPVKAMESKVNVVVTIRNTPDRNLTAEEEKEFTNKLIGFFDIQAEDVSVEDIEVWHQQKVDWVEDGGRNLQQMVSTAITLIFTISHYGDSSVSEIGNKLVNLMEENEGELVLLLRGSEHDFFLEADGMLVLLLAFLFRQCIIMFYRIALSSRLFFSNPTNGH